MAWDTERTRRLLLDAGMRRFAADGFAGASVQAIAADAGVSKERIYPYFGDKRGLFDAVLASQLVLLLDGLAVEGRGAAAAGTFAGALVDRTAEHPHVARLLAWESLELDAPVAGGARAEGCAATARALRDAIPGLDTPASEHLLLSIVTLATGWSTLARVADVVLAGDATASSRRAAIVAHATAMAAGLAAAEGEASTPA